MSMQRRRTHMFDFVCQPSISNFQSMRTSPNKHVNVLALCTKLQAKCPSINAITDWNEDYIKLCVSVCVRVSWQFYMKLCFHIRSVLCRCKEVSHTVFYFLIILFPILSDYVSIIRLKCDDVVHKSIWKA